MLMQYHLKCLILTYINKWGYSLKERAAITTQNHNLLEKFWPLTISIPIFLAQWEESFKIRKSWRKLWLCIIMVTCPFGRIPHL